MRNFGCGVFCKYGKYNMCIMVLCIFTIMLILTTQYGFSVAVIGLFVKALYHTAIND
jgi:hypothetical protein